MLTEDTPLPGRFRYFAACNNITGHTISRDHAHLAAWREISRRIIEHYRWLGVFSRPGNKTDVTFCNREHFLAPGRVIYCHRLAFFNNGLEAKVRFYLLYKMTSTEHSIKNSWFALDGSH